MMRTPPPSATLFLALSLLLPAPGLTRPITTAEITAETTAATLTCMRWTYIGVCVWLYCTPAGCVIRFSPKVAHYNPDLVISAYHRVGGNPWVEAAAAYGATNRAAAQGILSAVGAEVPVGGGDRSLDKAFPDHKDLVFKEADAIGHPAASITSILSAAQLNEFFLICPSETQSFFPYLLSGLDAVAWRLALPEMLFPQALIPGLREIGHFPLNTWGPVYPRHGFIEQTHATKAAAVCAQRAGDVVTRILQPHVYTPTSATRAPNPGIKVFYPGGLEETKCNTGWFQMHSPVPLPLCETFGQNDTLLPTSWGDYRTDELGDYAWTLWRPYKCCKRKGIYLGSIEIPWPVCSSNSLL
jgi:integrating conjugative element protein (TIGR03756 family)